MVNVIIVVSNALPLIFPIPQKIPHPWRSKRCQNCVLCFRQHFSCKKKNKLTGKIQFVAPSVSFIFVYGFQGVIHCSFSLIFSLFFFILIFDYTVQYSSLCEWHVCLGNYYNWFCLTWCKWIHAISMDIVQMHTIFWLCLHWNMS